MPQPPGQQNSREGNADLIRGAALFDTPEPGTGKLFLGSPFPGNGVLVVYPGCDVFFDAGGLVISNHDSDQLQLKARPMVAAIELKGDEIRLHPPASDPRLRAAARVCEQFDIDARDPLALTKLAFALVAKHYPATLFPGGKPPSSDERAMSIAWVVDQERRDDEPAPDAIRRARPTLLDYRLIDENVGDKTLTRLFRQGQALLRQHGIPPWRRRGEGRPRKNSTQKHS
jgi:hypothetical protein